MNKIVYCARKPGILYTITKRKGANIISSFTKLLELSWKQQIMIWIPNLCKFGNVR